MKTRVLAFVLVFGLVGCSVETSIRNEIRLGTFTFMPSESDDYQYVVQIKAIRDIGYDTAEPAIRMKIVEQLLGNSCRSPAIYEQRLIERENQPGTYLIKVICR